MEQITIRCAKILMTTAVGFSSAKKVNYFFFANCPEPMNIGEDGSKTNAKCS